MAREIVIVCDTCGVGGASAHAVQIDDDRLEVDLCQQHFIELRDQVATYTAAKPARVSKRRGAAHRDARRRRDATRRTQESGGRTAGRRGPAKGIRMPTERCEVCGEQISRQNLGRHVAAKHPDAAAVAAR